MKRLTCNIIIGQFQFDFVKEVEIESSWRKLTDLAKVELPRRIKWKNRLLKDEIKRGDEVEIWIGYDFGYQLEFKGFVTEVSAKIPTVIRCEDRMWQLKQITITRSWRSTSLRDMLREIVPSEIEISTIEMELGAFRVSKVNVAQVLDKLKDIYGLYSYFVNDVLTVGFPYSLANSETGEFGFQKNIISDDLKYEREDDLKLKVVAINIKPNGTKDEEEFGDLEGEAHTLHFYNLSPSELKKQATEAMKLLRYTGYRGSFETFGFPFVQHGDIASLIDTEYPEREGNYLIESTRMNFGVKGFRRIIKIGRQA